MTSRFAERIFAMCFRPADAGAGAVCPNCGKQIPVMGGVVLKKCPHCKADLEAPGAAPAPGAPSAPGAPAAPGAPKSPAPDA